MAEEPDRPRSWWQTLPGALTAVAGLITAVTGLLLALNQLGIVGRDSGGANLVTNGATVAGDRATTFTGEAADYDVRFPDGAKATFEQAVFEILEATAEPRNPGELSLALAVRMTNTWDFIDKLWNGTFVLLVDGIGEDPVSELDEEVESGTSEEGMVVFPIPERVESLVLRLRHHGEEVKLPLEVRRSSGRG